MARGALDHTHDLVDIEGRLVEAAAGSLDEFGSDFVPSQRRTPLGLVLSFLFFFAPVVCDPVPKLQAVERVVGVRISFTDVTFQFFG